MLVWLNYRALADDDFISAPSGMDDDVSKFIDARISLDLKAERRATGMRTLRIIYHIFSPDHSSSNNNALNGTANLSEKNNLTGYVFLFKTNLQGK